MEKEAIALLKQHGLRVTTVRNRVMQLFLEARNTALSNADILQQFDQLDRSTLFRTLRTLEEKGIIHQVFDHSGKPKYAVHSTPHTAQQKADNHVHFHCTKCEQTLCLGDTPLPSVQIPVGFKIETQHMVLSGSCNSCN